MSLVAFRCDGGARVGAGHVSRCLQLAEAFRRCGDDVVLVGEYEGTAAALVEAAGVDTQQPAAGAAAGVSPACDAAVVDSYEISASELTEVARALPVAAIVDRGEAPDGVVALDYHAGGSGAPRSAVAGWDYAPVDPRFVAARRSRDGSRLLIAVGGGETGRDLSEAAVAAARERGLEPDVAGSGAAARTGLLEAIADADLAISAAGVTAYELACAGVPAGLVPIAENQRRIADSFDLGGIALAGGGPGRLLDRLQDDRTRTALAGAGPAAIDGYGAARARDALRAAFAGRALPRVLRYRPATADDSPLQLAWRNDPATRAASWESEPVAAADHEAWFARALASAERTLLIVEDGRGPAGSVRFDAGGDGAEISVIVAPERRGAGVGAQAVREASELYLAAHPTTARIHASVRPGNVASLAAFSQAGFRPAPTDSPERRALTLSRSALASAPR